MNKESELDKQRANILNGLALVREKLIAYKEYKNTPIVISRNGKVERISPEEFKSIPQEG